MDHGPSEFNGASVFSDTVPIIELPKDASQQVPTRTQIIAMSSRPGDQVRGPISVIVFHLDVPWASALQATGMVP